MVKFNFFTQENAMSIRLIQSGLLSAMAALLIACGGGGGGGGSKASSTPPPPPSLSGVAAIGAAMANAKVTLKDSNGTTASTTADDNGNFSFSNVGGFTPPIMLRAEGTVNGTSYKLHSLLTSAPTTGNINLNVTPATEALTAQTLGEAPDTAFKETRFGRADPAKLQAAKAKLMEALQDTLLAMGLDTNAVDLMTSKFAADKTGLDNLLDKVEFSANSNGAINLKDKKSNSNTYVTINESDSSETVSKINVTVDGALDTRGIKALIDELINAVNKDTNPDSKYFDDGYLFQGTTKKQFMSQDPSLTNGSNFLTIDSNYKIKKCDQATNVCYVGLQIKTKSSSIALMNIDMGVKQDSNKVWKLYGDQAPFVFRSTPLSYYAESASDTGPLKNGSFSNGLAITFPGTACDDCSDKVYQNVPIGFSYNNGSTYDYGMTLKAG